MADPILLPGTIPGLLRRGAPAWDHTGAPGQEPCVVLGVDGDYAIVGGTLPEGAGWWEAHRLDEVSLDLRDPLGVAAALRWLAERVGMDAEPGPPEWGWNDLDGPFGGWWQLGAEGVQFVSAEHERPSLSGIAVPALDSLDLADPDADLLALRACVLHVAEVGA